MRIEIMDGDTVINTINADEAFSEQHYHGKWRLAEVQDSQATATQASPTVCSPAQGLVALYAIKQITEADVNAAIAGITDPVPRYTTQIAFARATE